PMSDAEHRALPSFPTRRSSDLFVEATALAAAVAWLDGVGLDAVAAHEHDLTGYALERLAEIPGLTVFGPALEHRGALVSFAIDRSEEHTSELQSRSDLVCRLLL